MLNVGRERFPDSSTGGPYGEEREVHGYGIFSPGTSLRENTSISDRLVELSRTFLWKVGVASSFRGKQGRPGNSGRLRIAGDLVRRHVRCAARGRRESRRRVRVRQGSCVLRTKGFALLTLTLCQGGSSPESQMEKCELYSAASCQTMRDEHYIGRCDG